jgi:hypothetical protein
VMGVPQARELYGSPNGDRWDLVREPGSEQVLVRHRPNAAPGGRASEIEVGEFLARGGRGSEQVELLQLIGSLVDRDKEALGIQFARQHMSSSRVARLQ